MPKFFNNFKKPCSWPIFGPCFRFPWHKKFFWKIKICHAQLHMVFQHHAKIQKKTIIRFQENAQTDGRSDGSTEKQTYPLLQDPYGYCWGVQQEGKHFRTAFFNSFSDVSRSSKSNFKNYFLYSIFLQNVTFVLRKFVTLQGILDFSQNFTQNFSKKYYFLPPDMHTYMCVSGGKCCFSENFAYMLNK